MSLSSETAVHPIPMQPHHIDALRRGSNNGDAPLGGSGPGDDNVGVLEEEGHFCSVCGDLRGFSVLQSMDTSFTPFPWAGPPASHSARNNQGLVEEGRLFQ